MQQVIAQWILLMVISVSSQPAGAYLATEYMDFAKYLGLNNKRIFVSSIAKDSSSLKCRENEIQLRGGAYNFLWSRIALPWDPLDWVCGREATEAENVYLDTLRQKEDCQPTVKEGCIGLPVVVPVGSYNTVPNRCGTDYLTGSANVFTLPITDSTAIALDITKYVDGKLWRDKVLKKPGKGKPSIWVPAPPPDPGKAHRITYNAMVTTGNIVCGREGAIHQYYEGWYASYPEFRLFLTKAGTAVFVLRGADTTQNADPGSWLVDELTTTRHGGHTVQSFTDFDNNGDTVLYTEYVIERGLLRRRVYDNMTKPHEVHRAVYDGGWFPDNQGK